ncbi:MAG: phospho-sugar mutase, partial [Clostridia bacterium]|nr:phospho-sugar mutase [Clostridia bacterium]
MNDYKAKYNLWLEKVTDSEVKTQLQKMSGDESAIKESFYRYLGFGTAGLRGELGAGTNCLNIYTIRKATQGVAECMKVHGHKTASVSCDSRINSYLFARVTAEVFASNGIKTYLTRELMPTPFLSFITRETGSQIGVMITASHNPARYNGYKVYGSDGCQLTDAYANEMTEYIEKVDEFSVVTKTVEEYEKEGLIEYISDDFIESYLTTVQKQASGTAEGIKVTYTPLNGAGYKLVPEILRRMKVERIDEVKEQAMPDGNFPTCTYPNPEKAEALALGLENVKANGSDILIATDPDCDRVGIAVPVNGGYRLMTGNEVGVLLTDYLLKIKKENGTLPARPVIVKTIVTSELVRKVSEPYGAELFDVLTGFKYIGDVIAKLEAKGEESRYILGFEESYGYLSGTYVRDKDAVNASMLIAEMTAYYKKQGKSLVDRLNEIYAM